MKKITLILIAVMLVAACGNKKEKEIKQIKDLETKILNKEMTLQKTDADSLIMLYDSFIGNYPADTFSAICLYNAQDILANTHQCLEAVKYIDKLSSMFPQSSLTELALFKKGYIYENTCLNKLKAKEFYEEFVKKYPESQYASQAIILIQMLDYQNDMDIIRQFEQKNADENGKKEEKQ